MHWLYVALGGALGSVARAAVAHALPATRFPWATLLVNVVGSFAIGLLAARFAADAVSPRWQAFWMVGVCGGFTTFSAFSWQTFQQWQQGHALSAAAYVLGSVAGCLLATWVGWRIAR